VLITPPYAIDIGDRTVKIAQLVPRRRWDPQHASPHLHTCAEHELTEGWVVNGAVTDPAALAAFLGRAIARASPWFLRSPHAVLTLPEARTFLTTITVAADEDRATAVRRAVHATIPVNADRAVISTRAIAGADDRIVVAAAPADVVESYAALLRRFGVTLIACTVESDALARAVAFVQSKPQPTIILDLGATRTGAIIASGPLVAASVTIPVSGTALTATVAARMRIDPAAAEHAKCAADLARVPSDDLAATAIAGALAPLVAEIRRLRMFADSHLPASVRPTRITLTGGGAALSGLDRFLHEQTRLPVDRFTLPPAVTAGLRAPMATHTERLATVFGLGLIALDPATALAE